MEKSQKRIVEESKKKEHQLKFKHEDLNIKRYQKSINIIRLNRIKDNEHKKQTEELNEKEKKIEDFKQQKMNVMQSKKEMTNEINKQKKIIVQKFENAMKNKRNKSIDPKIIKELFPEDESFYLRIKKMTEQINSNKNSSSQTRYNS